MRDHLYLVRVVLVLACVWMPLASFSLAQAARPDVTGAMQGSPLAVPALNDSLRPALLQVGSALNQVRIDRWKVSRDWKSQLRSDADSIHQDLSSQLPTLFQTAQQSPAALGPQLAVMHNVDALYDVLVRVTTAASIAGAKKDAATLNDVLAGLESARKSAATQLIQAASMRDQELLQFQARMQPSHASERTASGRKIIIVNNRISHRTKHAKAVQHPKPAGTTSATPY